MTIDEVLRALVREEVRKVVREELERALAHTATAHAHHDEYLTYKQAAEVANVSVGTIRKWIGDGLLQACGIGRSIRVRRSELDKVMTGTGRPDEPTVEQVIESVMRRTRRR